MNKGLSNGINVKKPVVLAGLTTFGYVQSALTYRNHYFAQFYSQLNQYIRQPLRGVGVFFKKQLVRLYVSRVHLVEDTSMLSLAAATKLGGKTTKTAPVALYVQLLRGARAAVSVPLYTPIKVKVFV